MSAASDREQEKRLAAEAAVELVEDGMRVGLGTGSTVAWLIPALARRQLALRCVATSAPTERLAREHQLEVEPFDCVDSLGALDIAIDGADQVARSGWVAKGAGGAHVREKVVAAAATRFVIIVDASKEVEALTPPVALELLAFGLHATLRGLPGAVVRPGAPQSPDGGVIAELTDADLRDPHALATRLDAVPGVVGHGLFPPELDSEVFVGRDDGAERHAVS